MNIIYVILIINILRWPFPITYNVLTARPSPCICTHMRYTFPNLISHTIYEHASILLLPSAPFFPCCSFFVSVTIKMTLLCGGLFCLFSPCFSPSSSFSYLSPPLLASASCEFPLGRSPLTSTANQTPDLWSRDLNWVNEYWEPDLAPSHRCSQSISRFTPSCSLCAS